MNYSLDKLNDLAAGDHDFIVSIVSVFVEETPVDLADLESAVAAANFEQIYQTAHKIKPNVDLLGMEGVTSRVLKIETEARGDKDLSVINSLFPGVKEDILTVIEDLKRDFGV